MKFVWVLSLVAIICLFKAESATAGAGGGDPLEMQQRQEIEGWMFALQDRLQRSKKFKRIEKTWPYKLAPKYDLKHEGFQSKGCYFLQLDTEGIVNKVGCVVSCGDAKIDERVCAAIESMGPFEAPPNDLPCRTSVNVIMCDDGKSVLKIFTSLPRLLKARLGEQGQK